MIYWGLTKSAGGSEFSRFIDRLTGGGGYCHAFLWLPDLDRVAEAHIDFGVRMRDRRPDPARERVFEFPSLSPGRERDMMRKLVDCLGNGYDTSGAIHLYCDWVKNDPSKQFCSEYDLMVGQAGLYWPGATPSEISPNAMPNLIIEEGATLKEVFCDGR